MLGSVFLAGRNRLVGGAVVQGLRGLLYRFCSGALVVVPLCHPGYLCCEILSVSYD